MLTATSNAIKIKIMIVALLIIKISFMLLSKHVLTNSMVLNQIIMALHDDSWFLSWCQRVPLVGK